MNNPDHATIEAATRQYQIRVDHLNQIAEAGKHNPDETVARLCRDYRLSPTTIIYLTAHGTAMMRSELRQ